ncbi:diguanylate cyclase [Planobispora siamensis]|uniref:GGDEF domain-containing protein n=1 Tax=Planobispora siamensis TaxID=936338 RepID=A0A8J3SNE0_9ACTN|nr:GGDEF domain-containing protein [Planobispora siamensis]GIH96405.1 hypothetical protein Psi01_70350 [Planobispora siamensis]
MNRSLTTAGRPAAGRSGVRGRRLPPAWVCCLLAGAGLIALYYAFPFLGASDDVQSGLYCVISGGSAVVIAAGIRWRRPRARLAWWLLAASQVMYTLGDLTYSFMPGDPGTSYPLLANIFYLLQYPPLALALILLIRRRTPGGDVPAMIDSFVISIGAALLYWMFLIGPVMVTSSLSPSDQFATLAFPVVDLLVLALSLRLVFGGGERSRSYHLLIGFLSLVLVADIGYGMQALFGRYIPGTALDLGWLSGYVLLGSAALHPSMARMGEQVPARPAEASRYRLVLLASATLMAPMVLLVRYLQDGNMELLVLAAASASLFLLVMARMSGLIAAQRRLAMTDALTGLSTRRLLEESMRGEISRSGRHGTTLGLLLIDVDHFKRVNDTFGHPAGDAVLAETARRIRAVCRDGDLAARFGGEEFAVLAPHTTQAGLALLAERIRAVVAAAPVAADESTGVPVTASVGGAIMPLHARTADDLIRIADEALYAAKNAGRNRVLIGPLPQTSAEPGAGPAAGPVRAAGGPGHGPAEEPERFRPVA